MIILGAISVHAERLTVNVRGEKVNLRAGPGKNYSVKWAYGSGFPVVIVERKGEWLRVKDFEDDTGWMHKTLLVNRPQTIVEANRYNCEKINIRKGPGSGTEIVARHTIV